MEKSSVIQKKMSKKEMKELFIVALLSAINIIAKCNDIGIVADMCTFLFVVYVISKPREKLLPLVAFSISNTGSLSLFTVSVPVLVAAIYVIQELFLRKKKIRADLVLMSMFYMLTCFQFWVRYSDFMSAVVFPLKLIILVLFFSLYSKTMKQNENKFILLFNTAWYGAVGIVVNSVTTTLVSPEVRLRVYNNDSNILGVEAVVFLSIICVLYFLYNIGTLMQFLLMTVAMSVVIVFTGSRNGLLLLGILFLLTLICNWKRISKTIFLYVGFILMVGFVLLSNYGQTAIKILVERAQVYESIGDISNGRFEIWQKYFDAFNRTPINWLFGFGNYTNVGISEMAHNGFLEDIASAGIIGYFLFIAMLVTIIKQYRKDMSMTIIKFYQFMPIVLVFIGTLTLRGFMSIINMFFLYLGIVLLYPQKGNKLNIDRI